MAIGSIKYDGAFQVTLDWIAGVRRTVVYCRPSESGLLSDEEIQDALNTRSLKSLCSGYEYGPETKHFSYSPEGLNARWIEICYCDFDMNGDIITHASAGRFFNGSCKVTYEVRRIPVTDGLEAIRLKVKNRSEFDLEAGGIGYAVSGRQYRIPVQLNRNDEKELPQFEVPAGASVVVKPVEGGYPVQAKLREAGKSRRGE